MQHNLLQCEIERMEVDFIKHHVSMHFPAGNCCDMDGAIQVATRVDVNCKLITTSQNGRPDTFYKKQDGGWSAWRVDRVCMSTGVKSGV